MEEGKVDYSFESKEKWTYLAAGILTALAVTPVALAWEISEKVRKTRKAQAGELEQEIKDMLNLIK